MGGGGGACLAEADGSETGRDVIGSRRQSLTILELRASGYVAYGLVGCSFRLGDVLPFGNHISNWVDAFCMYWRIFIAARCSSACFFRSSIILRHAQGRTTCSSGVARKVKTHLFKPTLSERLPTTSPRRQAILQECCWQRQPLTPNYHPRA